MGPVIVLPATVVMVKFLEKRNLSHYWPLTTMYDRGNKIVLGQ